MVDCVCVCVGAQEEEEERSMRKEERDEVACK